MCHPIEKKYYDCDADVASLLSNGSSKLLNINNQTFPIVGFVKSGKAARSPDASSLLLRFPPHRRPTTWLPKTKTLAWCSAFSSWRSSRPPRRLTEETRRLCCWARQWRSWGSARVWAGMRARGTASFNDSLLTKASSGNVTWVHKDCHAFILKLIGNARKGRTYIVNISYCLYSLTNYHYYVGHWTLPSCLCAPCGETSATVSALKAH